MKNFFLVFFILFVSIASAQEIDTTLVEDTVIVLQFDSIPKISFFNGSEGESISRISSFYKRSKIEDVTFVLFLVYSLLLSIVFINSRSIVSSSFKTLFNMQFAMQFYRTEKKRNTFYYILYLCFFIVGVSYLLFRANNQFSNHSIIFPKVLLFTILYFIFDYASSFIYLLFTKKTTAIETLQTSILSFSVPLCIFLWPLIVFIIVGQLFISFSVIIISLVIVAFFLVMRELRVIQILSNEKVDILSFHFFTYLCTFKFLPILLLVKVFFN